MYNCSNILHRTVSINKERKGPIVASLPRPSSSGRRRRQPVPRPSPGQPGVAWEQCRPGWAQAADVRPPLQTPLGSRRLISSLCCGDGPELTHCMDGYGEARGPHYSCTVSDRPAPCPASLALLEGHSETPGGLGRPGALGDALWETEGWRLALDEWPQPWTLV